jgi:hypothetical protein
MRKFTSRLAGVAALLLAAQAFAAPPAAPTVNVSGALKQLRFKWNYVPRANYYELWFRANPGATWVRYAEAPSWRPRVDITVSVHLLDWRAARYRVAACNPSGCTSSPEIAVTSLMPRTPIAFATTQDNDLGWTVDISEDGQRLVGGAPGARSGALYVWRREGASWTREAILQPNIIQAGAGYDHEAAINADGSVIALGARSEDPPNVDPDSEGETGAVYLFRRSGTSWHLEQKLTVADQAYGEQFGRHVQLDDSGSTLAAWRSRGGVPVSGGSVEIYRHTVAGWVREALVPTTTGDAEDCDGIALSGDGQTLVRDCRQGISTAQSGYAEVFRAPTWLRVARIPHSARSGNAQNNVGISYDGTRFAVRSVGQPAPFAGAHSNVEVFVLAGGVWTQEGVLEHGPWTQEQDGSLADSRFGEAISMSRDGRLLAIGDWRDTAAGTGVLYPPIPTSSIAAGGVYIFERTARGWRQRQFIKPFTEAPVWFGFSLALAQNGRTLAVGAPFDGASGLVWLY